MPILTIDHGANWGGGGAHPKKNQKKTSRYTKIGKLALVFWFFFVILKFPNWHYFFCFILAWVLARIRNWKLVFFGIGLGQHSKLETGYLSSFGFFLVFFGFFFGFFWFFFGFFGFLVSNFRVRIPSQKNQKKKKKQKKPKKTSRYTKIGKLACFFWFFLVFFWVSTPPPPPNSRVSNFLTIDHRANSRVSWSKSVPYTPSPT